MTKIKFSTSQFLAALALAAAIGLMIQAININPASALEGEVASENVQEATVSDLTQLNGAINNPAIRTIVLSSDIETNSTIEINIDDPDRELTIDLGGFEIFSTAGINVINITRGNVTIKGNNGTVAARGVNGNAIRMAGSTNAGDQNYTVVTIEKGVTLESSIQNGSIYGVFIGSNNGHAYGAVLNFNGTAVGRVGLYVNGNVKDTTGNVPQINVGSSAIIKSENIGIYAAGYANWNIGAAKITAGEVAPVTRAVAEGTGVGIKTGSLTFNGTTIEAYGDKQEGSTANNGINGTGSVFQIENNTGYVGQAKLQVNSGTYTSANNSVFYQYGENGQGLDSITINGGTFRAGDKEQIFDLSDGENSSVKVLAGTFSEKIPQSFLVGDWQQENVGGNWVVGATTPEPGVTNPTDPSNETDQDPAVTIPNTGAVSHGPAVNAIASISLVVSIFVAGGIFYNRYKVYHRVKAYVPNPSVNRIRRK